MGETINAPQPACRFLVCVGPRCDAQGARRAFFSELKDALAATFPDAKISCDTRDCLRLCTSDPIVRCEPSGEIFCNSSIDDLLRFAREAGARGGDQA